MALIKEPYGLVYNTDGTLCTTYRDDDIPFPGVRSFAVEEATTNLSPQTVSGYAGISLVYKGEENGWKKYGISGTWNSGTYPYCATISSVSFTGGEYYSTSAFFKTNCQEKFATYFSSMNYVNDPRISDGTNIRRVLNDGSIYLARVGFAYVDSTTQPGYITLRPKQDGETFNPDQHFLYVKNIQIEQKPYATSYVDGSRPAPALQFRPLPRETVNIGGTDWKVFTNTVISFWFKVPKVKDVELNTTDSYPDRRQYAIFTNNTHYFEWLYGQYSFGIQRNTGNLRFRIHNYNSVFITNLVPKGEYEDEWHFFVMCKYYVSGTFTMKYYYDSDLIYDTTSILDDTSRSEQDDDIFFYNYYKRSNLIANLFIGKYRKPNGDIIWTDDYIREVYEAQIPFPEQNKLSIY